MDDLQVLLPNRDIKIGEEVITLRPFSFGAIPKVMSHIQDISYIFTNIPPEVLELLRQEESKDSVLDAQSVMSAELIDYMSTIIEVGGDNVFNLMALATNKPVDWIKDLSLDEGISLLIDIFEINYDFFEKRFKPVMANVTGRAKNLIEMIKKN